VTEDDRRAGYEAVYDEAQRALELQRAALDALRTRAGIVLSAGAVSTSFLGGQALRDGVSALDWLATGLFVVFAALVLRVLWPAAEGARGFAQRPSRMLTYLEGGQPLGLEALYRDLALYAEEAHDVNRNRHLVPLTRTFRIATLAVVGDTVAWVVALAAGP
jgi:hypothetical protein